MKILARVLVSTDGRFCKRSGYILSGRVLYDFLPTYSMSHFGRENLRNDMSIFPQMVRRQVNMAVEEIRVEVVDDFLHSPSR